MTRSLRQAPNAGRAHQPLAWSRLAVLSALLVLPGLNHLFQEATTGLPGEYATIEQTVAPEALEKISGWVVAHTRS